jgi:hypothetical protein
MRIRRLAPAALVVGLTAELYRLTVTGGLTVDTGWGRTRRRLGPFGIEISADSGVVFDVIAGPYLGRTPRAMADKLNVLERGTDMVLAEHYTHVGPGLIATTLETVRFTRPDRVDFRLVRGPVPHLIEQFVLTGTAGGTRLDYGGELGADGWAAGRWWGEKVGTVWEAAVRRSFAGIKIEAERRTTSH